MRTNWNFSHAVTPRSEAFGRVDSATTGNADYSARAKALREAAARREAAVLDYAEVCRKFGQSK